MVSERKIQVLCTQERIEEATPIGLHWTISEEAEWSKGERFKVGRYVKGDR